ncbi:hypothetical protein KZZ52_33365 [Dactylosporangium sp. AC04546]|uniref:hypothetical protein n=1 Tax=Dactylosporangium sp. AC04546 TaxID=2862460 RepID=UPI001EDCF8CD|nr:hypothetical protein [Dactylosporangium sp. AC04546]WVK78871.1 hypothetical protein KZZ52_33365 [Dactylosporangium sp. AC04546]
MGQHGTHGRHRSGPFHLLDDAAKGRGDKIGDVVLAVPEQDADLIDPSFGVLLVAARVEAGGVERVPAGEETPVEVLYCRGQEWGRIDQQRPDAAVGSAQEATVFEVP